MELASFFLYYLTSVLFLRYGDFLQPGDANVESAFFDLRFDMVILYSQETPIWNWHLFFFLIFLVPFFLCFLMVFRTLGRQCGIWGNSEIPSAVGYLNCPDFVLFSASFIPIF